jgi:CheY-like chemotaxis protein
MDILVIDDSKFVRSLLRNRLQDSGYEVGELDPTSLFEVLSAIHANRPRLVITDYEMPFCNGEAILTAIREDPTLKGTPVIVLSSHREEELVERLTNLGLAGYVLKPVKPEELVKIVQRFFET